MGNPLPSADWQVVVSDPLQQIAVLGFYFLIDVLCHVLMFVHRLSFSISAVFVSIKECMHIKNIEGIEEEVCRLWQYIDYRSLCSPARGKEM